MTKNIAFEPAVDAMRRVYLHFALECNEDERNRVDLSTDFTEEWFIPLLKFPKQMIDNEWPIAVAHFKHDVGIEEERSGNVTLEFFVDMPMAPELAKLKTVTGSAFSFIVSQKRSPHVRGRAANVPDFEIYVDNAVMAMYPQMLILLAPAIESFHLNFQQILGVGHLTTEPIFEANAAQ